jgi:sugar O-acyltransferase (sialic acid O-acetyltransferase NeuD family)
MTRRQPIFVYGASGHAKVVIDAVERERKYDIALLVDDNPNLEGKSVYGYSKICGREDLIDRAKRAKIKAGIVAIGNNSGRERLASWLAGKGFGFVTVVHPSATIARGVSIGAGTVILPGAIVNSDTTIGEHVIINTGATVDHDCAIGAFSHIAPGAHLCGTVIIGRNGFICAGATIVPNRSIGQNVVVGAGSTVIQDIPSDVTAVGSPAQILDQRKKK